MCANLMDGARVRIPGASFSLLSSSRWGIGHIPQSNPRTPSDPNDLLQIFNDLARRHHDDSFVPPLARTKAVEQFRGFDWQGAIVFAAFAIFLSIVKPESLDIPVAIAAVLVVLLP